MSANHPFPPPKWETTAAIAAANAMFAHGHNPVRSPVKAINHRLRGMRGVNVEQPQHDMLLRHLHQLLSSSYHNNRVAAHAEIKALTAILRVVHGEVGWSVRRYRYAVGHLAWFGEFLEGLEGLDLANEGVSVFAYLGIGQDQMGAI